MLLVQATREADRVETFKAKTAGHAVAVFAIGVQIDELKLYKVLLYGTEILPIKDQGYGIDWLQD